MRGDSRIADHGSRITLDLLRLSPSRSASEHGGEPRERSEPTKRRARGRAGESEGEAPRIGLRASMASEPRDRSEPTKRRARARVGESEGRSPSDR